MMHTWPTDASKAFFDLKHKKFKRHLTLKNYSEKYVKNIFARRCTRFVREISRQKRFFAALHAFFAPNFAGDFRVTFFARNFSCSIGLPKNLRHALSLGISQFTGNENAFQT